MALVERCRQGDLAAFEELYRAHAGKLFSVACRMLGNPTDAEDLLQEIFLSAHRKLDGFRGESALGTWLYRLATNHCLDYLRSRAARTNQLTDVAGRRAEPVRGGQQRPGGADGDEDGSRTRDGPAARGVPRRLRAARRPGARAPRSGRGPRHRGRHVEVAGAQGAAAGFARCCPSGSGKRRRRERRQDGQNTCSARDTGNGFRSSRTGPSGRSAGRSSSVTWTSARTAARSRRTCRRSATPRPRSSRSRRPTACGSSLRDGCGRKGACRSRRPGRRRRRAMPRCSPSRPRSSSRSARRSSCCCLSSVRTTRRSRRPSSAAPQPGNAAPTAAVQSVETEFRLAEQHYQNAIAKLEQAARLDEASADQNAAIDPQTAAMLQKNLQVIDQAIAESRSALRSEPQSASGARQPVRRAQAEGHAAAGHDRLDERNAQRQFGRRGPDRRRRQQIVGACSGCSTSASHTREQSSRRLRRADSEHS